MSPAVLLNAVRHYPLTFAGLVALAAGVAAAVWLFMPLPKHTASVVYHISGQPPRVINAPTDGQADLNSYRQLQASIVKRRLVLNAALNNLKPGDAPLLKQQPDPVAWLDKNLQVDFRAGSEFMRVYLEGDNPDELLAVVRAVAAAYQAEVEQREKGATKKRLDTIATTITQHQEEIAAKLKRIDVIARTLKTTDGATLVAMEAVTQENLKAARRDLLDVQTQLELARSELPPPGAALPAVVIPAAAVDEAVGREPTVLAAEGKVRAARDALQTVEARTVEGAPARTQARADLTAAEAARDKTRADVRAAVEAGVRERAAGEAAAAAAARQERYNQLERRRKVVDGQIQDIKNEIARHGDYRLELEQLRKEIGHREKLLDALAEEREKVRVEERAASRVRLEEEPYVQAGVEGFRRLRMTLVAGAGLFTVGFAGLVWWEYRSRRVTRTDEVAQSLGLPLLGTLPPWDAMDQPGEHGELVEAIDATRTVLLHGHTTDHPLRTLAVTSALPGEGKTSLSGHLAISLARAGYRTLLVDGDVRGPSAHKVFNLPPGPGLCEVLRGEVAAAAVSRDTKVPNLSVMPAGRWSLTARQALVGDRWGVVRRQLERQFDYVVLDTAPLLLATDSLLLARGADGVVLSVLMGVSRLGSVAHTQERLASLGARVLGVVVSGARPEYTGAYPYGGSADRPESDPDPVPLTPA
jgi:capsular exopolysaccharide synthesis family protein